MNPAAQRAAFIIAGGRSTRMGVDKAFVDLGGLTLLERALACARAVCANVTIVGDPAKFSAFERVVEDIYRDCGPLAGIHAALLRSSADLNLMLAVDLPFVSRSLLAFLFTIAEKTDAVVTVPITRSRFQPLCAIYRSAFANPAQRALKAGKYKIDALFSTVSVRTVDDAELAAAGFSPDAFRNLNTPSDLDSARSHFLSS